MTTLKCCIPKYPCCSDVIQGDAILMAAKASLDTSQASPFEMSSCQASDHSSPSPSVFSAALPPSPPSPSSPPSIQYLHEFSSCGALLLSQKLRNLELQTRETDSTEMRRSALDPSCLLTPPNTPHIIDPVDLVREEQDLWMKADSGTLPWSSCQEAHDEGTEKLHIQPHLLIFSRTNEIKYPLFSPQVD